MNIINEEKKYVLQTYKKYDIQIVKAKGKYVWDDKGKRYLDLFSGLSVCNIGHCNSKVVDAIKKQISKVMHTSNLYYNEPQVLLAKELMKRNSFKGKLFFSNSGAEANECAIKLVRKWASKEQGKIKRYEIITFENAFHGRTIATLSAAGQEKLHKGFEPLLPGFKYAKLNDINSVKKLLNAKTAAIMVEPIQGESGINLCTKEFLTALRNLCNQNNLLLVFDEVQTGMGRTGKFFAYQSFGVVPDIVTLAKSLGGGLPIGATIVRENIADYFGFGDHGSTFGANLVCCAAGVESVKFITPALLANVKKTSDYFLSKLEGLKTKYEFIKEVRGMGLMIGVELDFPCREIVEFCNSKGLLINCAHDVVLRFLPPLTADKKDVETAIKILEEAFKWKRLKK